MEKGYVRREDGRDALAISETETRQPMSTKNMRLSGIASWTKGKIGAVHGISGTWIKVISCSRAACTVYV